MLMTAVQLCNKKIAETLETQAEFFLQDLFNLHSCNDMDFEQHSEHNLIAMAREN